MSKAEILRARALLDGFYEPEKVSRSRFQTALHELVNPLAVILTAINIALVFAAQKPALLWLLIVIPVLSHYRRARALHDRKTRFDADYTTFLTSLASGVRTGLDPLDAMTRTAMLFSSDSVVREYVVGFKAAIDTGVKEEDAIRELAQELEHSDLPLFKTALLIARKEGASLGVSLERLARVTRQRQSFRRKTRAAIAMQKLSAFGMIGCTLLIGLIQYFSNPHAIFDALQTPQAVMLIGGGVVAVVLGVVAILRIAKGGLWAEL